MLPVVAHGANAHGALHLPTGDHTPEIEVLTQDDAAL